MAFDQYQLATIENDDLNLVTLAGAGSGKTTSMIGRVLRALNQDIIMRDLNPDKDYVFVDPSRIYVTSFTNIAANTFRDRIAAKINNAEISNQIRVSTLDTLALDIIRAVYPETTLDFGDYDAARIIYNDLNVIDKTDYPTFINYYEKITDGSFKSRDTRKAVFEPYLDLVSQRLLDRIREEPDGEFSVVLKTVYDTAIDVMINEKFIPDIGLLIVDEVQDTNEKQFMLLQFLRTQLPDMQLVAIGDVSQSMYRWNGARPANVTDFIREFHATVLTLPNNYRSNKLIIDYANAFLRYNLDNIANIQLENKHIGEAEIPHTAIPTVNFLETPNAEESDTPTVIASKIDELINTYHVNPSDIAVIARTNKDVDAAAEALSTQFDVYHKNNKAGIRRYYERAITKLKPYADVFRRRPTDASVDQFINMVLDESHHDFETYISRNVFPIINGIPDTLPLITKIQVISSEITSNVDKCMQNLNELMFKGETEQTPNQILLSTVHGVKGDEFKYVFYIPSSYQQLEMKTDYREFDPLNPDNEELWGSQCEIQNIHYVAITRAIDKLFIVQDRLVESIESAKRLGTRVYPEYNMLMIDKI